MGEYTEIALLVPLKHPLPDEVDQVLSFLCDYRYPAVNFPLPDHEFFSDKRWDDVASRGTCASMHRLGGEYSHNNLSIASSVKQGYTTYAKFLDWLAPHVETEEWSEEVWDMEKDAVIELPPEPKPVFGGYLHDENDNDQPSLIWFSRGKVHLVHQDRWTPDG